MLNLYGCRYGSFFGLAVEKNSARQPATASMMLSKSKYFPVSVNAGLFAVRCCNTSVVVLSADSFAVLSGKVSSAAAAVSASAGVLRDFAARVVRKVAACL